jgi:cell division protein FtsW
MFGLMQVGYHNYRHPAIVFSLLSAVIALLLLAYLMPATANTHRWIRIAGLSFQPAELAKLAVVLFLAWFLEMQKDRIHSFRETLVPVATIVAVVGGLVVLQPDLGTALVIVGVAALLLFSAGLEWRWIGLGFAMAAPAFYVFVYSVPWRWTRFAAFLDPWSDSLGSGYQIIQSLTSVGSGGVTGVGLMEGQQKLFFLPEPHTDFIFAVVGEELGMIGTLMVLGLFGIFTWRGLRAAMRAPDPHGCYLALGITLMVSLQAFFNMSVVLGLLPTKGIPLPFLSYGGSSFLIMLLGVGVLMNVSQRAG